MAVRRLILIFLTCFCAFPVYPQNSTADSLKAILPLAEPEAQTRLLVRLAESTAEYHTDIALLWADSAINMAQSLDQKQAEAEALFLKGTILDKKTRYEDALEQLNQSVAIFDELGQQIAAIRVVNQQGLTCKNMHNTDESLRFFNIAKRRIESLQRLEPDSDTAYRFLITAVNNIGIIYLLRQRYDTAMIIYTDLMKRTDSTDFRNRLYICGNLSYIYIKRGDYDSALRYAFRMQDLATKPGLEPFEARAKENIGNIYFYLGNYRKAVDYLSEALTALKTMSNKPRTAACYNNLASVYQKFGFYDSAVACFQHSLDIKQKLHDSAGMALVYGNIGIVYNDWGNNRKAREYHLKSLEIKHKSGDLEGIAKALSNLAVCFTDSGQPDSALMYYKKSVEMAGLAGITEIQMESLFGLGELYREHLNDLNKALNYYQRAIKMAVDQNAGYWKAYGNIGLGKILINQQRYKQALRNFQEGLAYADATDAYELQLDSYDYLSRIYEAIGNPARSLAYYKLYTQRKDSIFNEEKARVVSEMQTRYETEKKEKENLALRKNNEIQGLIITGNNRMIRMLVIGITVVLLLLVLILNLYRKRNIAYKDLVTKNLELARQDRNLLEKGEWIEKTVALQNKEDEGNHDQWQKEQDLVEKFNRYFAEEKPYLYGDISLEDVAVQIGTNRTYLSKAINSVLNKSFNTLTNEFRVRSARQLLTDPKYAHISLEGIGEMVGYNSRIAFYKNFKKFTGLTPSYYRESIRVNS